MQNYTFKECYYCKTTRKFYIRAGYYGAFFACEQCGRTINITRNADEAKRLFPDFYKDKSDLPPIEYDTF